MTPPRPQPPRSRPAAPQIAHSKPQAPQQIVYVTRHVQTVEKTSKTWKALQALGVLAVFGGIFFIFTNSAGTPQNALGILGSISGFVCYVIGRIGAWWCNG